MAGAEGSETEQSPLLPQLSSSTSSETLTEVENGSQAYVPKYSITPLRGFLVLISMAVLILLQASNVSLLTTTQSAVAADLDAYTEASWMTSTYLISMSSVVPVAGKLSQIISPRICVFIASLLLALGSLVTALAPSFAGFLLGRSITGVGAAGVFPISIALVLELTTKKRRGLFIGLVNSGFTTGVTLGAVVAGAVAPSFGWRVVFWMQVPLALVAGVCIFCALPESLIKRKESDLPTVTRLLKIDYAGVVTLTSSLVLLLFSLASPRIPIVPIIVSVCLLVLFVVIEMRYSPEPIIPVSVLKNRGALFTCFATLGLMLSRWTVLFYTPVYAISLRGWHSASAGTMLIPTNAGFAIGGLLVGWIHIRKPTSYYFSCLLVIALFSVDLFVLSLISNPDSSALVYMLVVFCNGLCTGSALNYTLAHFLHLTLPETHVVATALLVTFRGFAGSIGSATAGGIFGRVLNASLEEGFERRGMTGRGDLMKRLLGSPALVAGLAGAEKEVAVEGYVAALKAIFVAGSILAAVVVLVQAATGWKAPVEDKEEEENGGVNPDGGEHEN